jgi:shikimate kinase
VPPDPETQPPRNIVLIGFMGTGKSALGKELAAGLHFDLIDTDQLIADASQQSIPEIFSLHGEPYFRDLEANALRALAGRTELVICTGGGIIVRPENRTLLKQLGFVVWLDAPEDTVYDRISRKRDRPLLQTENPRATISRLLRDRRPLYRDAANLVINTGQLDLEKTARGIIDSALVYFSRQQT